MYLAISLILLLSAVLCLASLVIEEKSINRKFFSDEQKYKLKDIISNYKYDVSKHSEESIKIPAAFSQCFNIFNDNDEKGWSSPPTSTCVPPGNQCTADYRNITGKHSNDLNNTRGSSSSTGWNTPQGWNSDGWTGSSFSPPTSKTCCNQDICTNGFCCTPAPALSTHSICKTNSDCCGFLNGISQCSPTLGICLLTLGTSCNSTNQCISGICDGTCCYPTGTCMPADSRMCTSDTQCCGYGVCMDGRCLSSEEEGCCSDSDCVSPNKCTMGTCTACVGGGETCSATVPCCPGENNICNIMTNVCTDCQTIGGSCTSTPSDPCCAGGVCTAGTCVAQCGSNGDSCTLNPDTCCNPGSLYCDGSTCAVSKDTGFQCTNDYECKTPGVCRGDTCCILPDTECAFGDLCCFGAGSCPLRGTCPEL